MFQTSNRTKYRSQKDQVFIFFPKLKVNIGRNKGKEIIMILKLKVFRYWNCLLSGYFMFAIGWVHQVIISCVELYSQVKLQTETEFHTSNAIHFYTHTTIINNIAPYTKYAEILWWLESGKSKITCVLKCYDKNRLHTGIISSRGTTKDLLKCAQL